MRASCGRVVGVAIAAVLVAESELQIERGGMKADCAARNGTCADEVSSCFGIDEPIP